MLFEIGSVCPMCVKLHSLSWGRRKFIVKSALRQSASRLHAGNTPMDMKKMVPAANPDAHVAILDGWRRSCVEHLRKAVRSVAQLEEAEK